MKKINAKILDKKFDEGKEEILDYFEAENVIKRVNVDFPLWMVNELDKEAARLGITRQSLIKVWIGHKLQDSAKNVGPK